VHVQLTNFKTYLNKRRADTWHQKYKKLTAPVSFDYTTIELPFKTVEGLDKFQHLINNVEVESERYNKDFVSQEKKAYASLFENLEAFPLDSQQIDAILHDEDNSLIIAGAGTGKTSTILGKTAYVTKKGLARPEELLLIAFTSAAAAEMKERVEEKLGIAVKVKTFHSFGYEVIGQVEGAKPSLAFDGNEYQVKQFLNRQIYAFQHHPKLMDKLTQFFAYDLIPEKEEKLFKNLNDYYKYIKSFQLLTFQGETVKSLEELKIANFLFLNQIKYEYEAKFQPEQRNPDYKVYRPDFYLPDYDIYIEHYGVDRNYNVPPFFKGRNGLSAKAYYKQGIDWKRSIHENNSSHYIETFSYENREGILFTELKQKLEKYDVLFRPLSPEAVFKTLEKHKYIPAFIDLVFTFLTLVKSNHVTMAELKQKAIVRKDQRALAFLELFETLFEAYQKYLEKKEEIDFSDMISKATNYLKNKQYISRFKYIIIDEFQDMSVGRYNFIKALRDQNPKQKLYCVGDDWQSIFRFAGSDISITTKFADYFGYTYTGRIETTYRFNNKILAYSSSFIQKNPFQLKKKLQAKSTFNGNPFEIHKIISTKQEEKNKENNDLVLLILRNIQMVSDSKKPDVFIIGRYKHTKPDNFERLKQLFPDLNIEFYTAHKSKGLTCDYAILMDLSSGKYGFPTEIADDPILSLILHEEEAHDNAEERRLFYVAITRARHQVFIITPVFNKSKFIEEMEITFNSSGEDKFETCISCEALMVERKGQYGRFWACTNYPFCNQTQKIYEDAIG